MPRLIITRLLHVCQNTHTRLGDYRYRAIKVGYPLRMKVSLREKSLRGTWPISWSQYRSEIRIRVAGYCGIKHNSLAQIGPLAYVIDDIQYLI